MPRRAVRPSWRQLRRSMLAAVVMVASSAVASAEIPYPTLSDVDPRVRQKIDEAYAAVETDLGNGEAWGRYGMILDAHRHVEEAAAAYREAERLDPEDVRWPYFLAFLLDYRDPEGALQAYERATDLRPSYAPARIRYAQALEAVGRDDDAEEQYRSAADLDPEDPLAPLGLGRLALAGERTEEAVRHLERAYSLNRGDGVVVTTLARAYARTGLDALARKRAAEARGLPRAQHQKDPLRESVLAAAQITALQIVHVEHPSLDEMETSVREQLRASRARLDSVLSQGRGVSAQALGNAFGDLGELYLIYDLTQAARSCLINAARLLNTEARWPHLLGTSHEQNGELEDAKRWYGAAETLDDTYVPTLVHFGRVSQLLGDVEEANAALARARQLDPELAQLSDVPASFSDPIVEEVRARVTGVRAAAVQVKTALRDGELETAVALARAAADGEPMSAAGQQLLAALSGEVGGALARQGRLDEAESFLEHATRLAPEQAGIVRLRASVLDGLGRSADATTELQRFVELRPDLPEGRVALARKLDHQGRQAEAIDHLEAAVASDPEHLEARQLLAILYGQRGRYLDAARHQEVIVHLRPEQPQAHLLLATARILGGDHERARQGLIEALRVHQNEPRIADALARLLAAAPEDSLRDADKAIELASRLFRDRATPDRGETLAMALAEAGNFEQAIALQERMLAQRRAAGQEHEVDRASGWLETYRRGQAVRSPWRD